MNLTNYFGKISTIIIISNNKMINLVSKKKIWYKSYFKMTKIFCDSADKLIFKKFLHSKIVKGFTTNPSLMRKAGAKSYEDYSKQLIKISKWFD